MFGNKEIVTMLCTTHEEDIMGIYCAYNVRVWHIPFVVFNIITAAQELKIMIAARLWTHLK